MPGLSDYLVITVYQNAATRQWMVAGFEWVHLRTTLVLVEILRCGVVTRQHAVMPERVLETCLFSFGRRFDACVNV